MNVIGVDLAYPGKRRDQCVFDLSQKSEKQSHVLISREE